MGKASREKKIREAAPGSAAPVAPFPAPRIALAGQAPAGWLQAVVGLSLVALAFAVYYPCLHGEFVFDDHNAILQSLLVREIWPLTRFITFSNRPVVDFSFALNYAQGEYDTWWFHFTNIAIHAATAIVLYLLAVRTLRFPAFSDRYAAWSQPIAWVAAAIFVCHPLASEPVAYVSSRSEGLAGFFYLLTILVYSIAISADKPAPRRAAAVAIPIATALALASKEIAATIPLALILYDFVFPAASDIRSTKYRARTIAYSLIPLLLGGAYFVIRAFASGTMNTPYQQSAGFGFDRFTPLQYLDTQFGVLTHYLRLLVVPTGLNMDYDWPLARSPFDLAVILPFFALVALTIGAYRVSRSHPFAAFAFFFFLLVLAPTSSFMPLADLAVERRMYIPLAGFSLFAAAAAADLARVLTKERKALVLAGLACVVVAIFAATTRARAVQWGNHLVLYEDAILKSPGSPRVRLNLGVVHLNAGRHDQAHEVLFEAKRLYDEGKSIHAFPRIGAFINYNLGAIQFIRQEYDDSLTYMRNAIEVGGQYVALRPRAYVVIGHIYKLRGQHAAAEEAFKEALRYNQDFPDWMYALAESQIHQDKLLEAKKSLFRLFLAHPETRESAEAMALQELILERQREKRGDRRHNQQKVTE